MTYAQGPRLDVNICTDLLNTLRNCRDFELENNNYFILLQCASKEMIMNITCESLRNFFFCCLLGS